MPPTCCRLPVPETVGSRIWAWWDDSGEDGGIGAPYFLSRMDTQGRAADDSHFRCKSEHGAPRRACRREWRATMIGRGRRIDKG